MARQRMIQPEIWIDSGFLEMSDRARLLWIGMISFADDEGRGQGSSKSLKAAIFPGDDISSTDVDALKAEVAKHVRVEFYDVDGQTYYQIEKWSQYQKISHPNPSSIPAKPSRKNVHGTLSEDSRNDHGTFSEHYNQHAESFTEHSGQLVSQLVSQLDNKCPFPEDSRNDHGTAAAPFEVGAGPIPKSTTKEKLKSMFSKIQTDGGTS